MLRFLIKVTRGVARRVTTLVGKLLFISTLPTALATIIPTPHSTQSSNNAVTVIKSPQNLPGSHQTIFNSLGEPKVDRFEGLEDDGEIERLNTIQPLASDLLMSGIIMGSAKIVNDRLEADPQLLDMPDKKTRLLPFHYAVVNGRFGIAKLLCEVHGFNASQPIAKGQGQPNLVGLDGLTLACIGSYKDLVEYFVTATDVLNHQLLYGSGENNCLIYANDTIHNIINTLRPGLYRQLDLKRKLWQTGPKLQKNSTTSALTAEKMVGATVCLVALAGYQMWRRSRSRQPKSEESISQAPPLRPCHVKIKRRGVYGVKS